MNFKITKRILSGLVFLFVVLISTNATSAQTGTSSITGTVTDSQGAVIPGAMVTLTNPAKGFTRSVQTSDSGSFTFSSVLPDTYIITIEKEGFKTQKQTDVKALIDSTASLNVMLEIGEIGEVVSVNADSLDSLVNTQDASIGNNFLPRQIQQLPTESRNVAQLLSIQPGVTQDGYVNGGRSDQSNITLDGVDINDQQQGIAFEPVLRITAESVEEFRVTTTNPSAAQGRSSGAQVSLLSKSGTNQFHGAAFWLPRRTFGSANDFFNNRAGLPRPNLARDVFGGAIGGPIVKDKVFFFYSYEGWREKIETPVVSTVPLPSMGQGILNVPLSDGSVATISSAQFLSIFPTAGQNPLALSALAAAASRYPANDSQSGAGDELNTSGYRFNAATPYDQNTHVLRFDWNISSNQQAFVRFNKQHDVLTNPPAFPDTPSPELWTHNTGLAFGHNWVLGSNMTNSFRYGLTRQAFTQGGDSSENGIFFRFVFSPLNFDYGLSRVTPTHNFTDDFTWIKGNHTIQFGGNVRLIRNKRVDNGPSYDNAVINPSYYSGSGRSLLNPIVAAGYATANNNILSQAAVAALIGRFSQYTANYNYDLDGNLLATGTPIEREFATEEYDFYIQDSWKVRPNFTLNLGLRYGLSRPVYEKNGYQIRPETPLGDYFEEREFNASHGVPYNETLNFELAGPSYDKPGYYSLDKNNFQPRISAAWSPDFKSGFWSKLFGKNQESVLRGGFAVTNDYFGQQLAVTFNRLSTLGFLTSDTIAPNTYNVTDSLGPLFSGFGQTVNTFPGVNPLPNRFQTPADEDTRIENSLDSTLQSPINYNWTFTYGRKLPKGLYVEASYVGRKARHLLVERDVMQPNNLVDPISGMDWYTAAGKIYDYFYSGTDISTIPAIPYFENLFPGLGPAFGRANATQAVMDINEAYAYGDWTYLQYALDDDFWTGNGSWSNLFYQPQYAAFAAFSTVGKSDYHGGSISVRQRLGESVSYDFNYTFSKSKDDASGLQRSGGYGAAFILNSLRQSDSYAYSDFDTRHVINAAGTFQLPFGRGKAFFSDSGRWTDALIGGWQLGALVRWNSGRPFNNLTDLAGWATNWQIRSSTVLTRQLQTSPTRGGTSPANIFSDLDALRTSVRPARPGETGNRNIFRGTPYSVVDMNLGKTFAMPWSEDHKLQFRWEVFNVFNHQYLDENSIQAFSFSPADPLDPDSTSSLTSGTGEFSGIKGSTRRMQFVFRYSF